MESGGGWTREGQDQAEEAELRGLKHAPPENDVATERLGRDARAATAKRELEAPGSAGDSLARRQGDWKLAVERTAERFD